MLRFTAHERSYSAQSVGTRLSILLVAVFGLSVLSGILFAPAASSAPSLDWVLLRAAPREAFRGLFACGWVFLLYLTSVVSVALLVGAVFDYKRRSLMSRQSKETEVVRKALGFAYGLVCAWLFVGSIVFLTLLSPELVSRRFGIQSTFFHWSASIWHSFHEFTEHFTPLVRRQESRHLPNVALEVWLPQEVLEVVARGEQVEDGVVLRREHAVLNLDEGFLEHIAMAAGESGQAQRSTLSFSSPKGVDAAVARWVVSALPFLSGFVRVIEMTPLSRVAVPQSLAALEDGSQRIDRLSRYLHEQLQVGEPRNLRLVLGDEVFATAASETAVGGEPLESPGHAERSSSRTEMTASEALVWTVTWSHLLRFLTVHKFRSFQAVPVVRATDGGWRLGSVLTTRHDLPGQGPSSFVLFDSRAGQFRVFDRRRPCHVITPPRERVSGPPSVLPTPALWCLKDVLTNPQTVTSSTDATVMRVLALSDTLTMPIAHTKGGIAFSEWWKTEPSFTHATVSTGAKRREEGRRHGGKVQQETPDDFGASIAEFTMRRGGAAQFADVGAQPRVVFEDLLATLARMEPKELTEIRNEYASLLLERF